MILVKLYAAENIQRKYIQSENMAPKLYCPVESRCIHPAASLLCVPVQVKLSITMVKKDDRMCRGCWCQTGWFCLDFPEQWSLWFTENGIKKLRYPVSCIFLGGNTFLMPKVSGEWSDGFEPIVRQQEPFVTIKVCRRAALSAQHKVNGLQQQKTPGVLILRSSLELCLFWMFSLPLHSSSWSLPQSPRLLIITHLLHDCSATT